MNSTEFRAVLDWWMCSDPWPEVLTPRVKETVDAWLRRECVSRGYAGIIAAYHRHESPAGSGRADMLQLRERIAAMDPYTAQGATDAGLHFADISTEYVKAFQASVLDMIDESLGAPKSVETEVPASEAYSGSQPDQSRDRGPPGPGAVLTAPVSLSDSALSRLGQAMLADYIASTYTVDHVLSFLDERAAWIDREMRNGGNPDYLGLKYQECRYIAQCIRDTRARLAKEPQS